MANAKPFPCTACGACCRIIGIYKRFLKPEDFPYETRADNSCEKLGPDNRCTIYETRPDMCRVDKMYERFHEPRGVSREAAYRMTAKVCNETMETLGVAQEYRISLEDI